MDNRRRALNNKMGIERTMQVNPAVELIGQFQRDLRVKGAGQVFPQEKMSGYMPMRGQL